MKGLNILQCALTSPQGHLYAGAFRVVDLLTRRFFMYCTGGSSDFCTECLSPCKADLFVPKEARFFLSEAILPEVGTILLVAR